jgi:hypothetical protein
MSSGIFEILIIYSQEDISVADRMERFFGVEFPVKKAGFPADIQLVPSSMPHAGGAKRPTTKSVLLCDMRAYAVSQKIQYRFFRVQIIITRVPISVVNYTIFMITRYV